MNGYQYSPHEYLSQDFDSIDSESILSQSEYKIHLCIYQLQNNISQIKYTNMTAYKEKIPYLTFHLENVNNQYSFPTLTVPNTIEYTQFTTECYLHLIKAYGLDQSGIEQPSGEESSPFLGFFTYENEIICLISFEMLLQSFNKKYTFPKTYVPAIVDEFMRQTTIHSIPINTVACKIITNTPFLRTIRKQGIVAPYPIRFYHAILTADESSPNSGTLENVLETEKDTTANTLYSNEQLSTHPIFGELYLFTDSPVATEKNEKYLRYACYLSNARYFDVIQREMRNTLSAEEITPEAIIPKIVGHLKIVNLELGIVEEYAKHQHSPDYDPEVELTELLSDISTMHFLVGDVTTCGLKYDSQFTYY